MSQIKNWANCDDDSDDDSGGNKVSIEAKTTSEMEENSTRSSEVSSGKTELRYQNKKIFDRRNHDVNTERQNRPTRMNQSKSFPDANHPLSIQLNNLNFRATVDDVGNYFHKGGCNVADVQLGVNGEGKSDGSALVIFEDKESLLTAYQANGMEFMGRTVKIINFQRKSRSNPDVDNIPPRSKLIERRSNKDDSVDKWVRQGVANISVSDVAPKVSRNEVSVAKIHIQEKEQTKTETKDDGTSIKTRSKLVLEPRKIQITDSVTSVSPTYIFGTGKPREEKLKESSKLSVDHDKPQLPEEIQNQPIVSKYVVIDSNDSKIKNSELHNKRSQVIKKDLNNGSFTNRPKSKYQGAKSSEQESHSSPKSKGKPLSRNAFVAKANATDSKQVRIILMNCL